MTELHKTSGYWTTTDLMERYKVTSRTLNRWMNRKENPLPEPKFKGSGSRNRWAIESLLAWENNGDAA